METIQPPPKRKVRISGSETVYYDQTIEVTEEEYAKLLDQWRNSDYDKMLDNFDRDNELDSDDEQIYSFEVENEAGEFEEVPDEDEDDSEDLDDEENDEGDDDEDSDD